MMNTRNVTLLVKRQWAENSRGYGVGLCAMAGILAMMFVITDHWASSFLGAVGNGIFLIMLFGSGGIFTAAMFNCFSNKSQGMWYLCLPASALDKLIAVLFYTLIVFPLVFFPVFYLVDFVCALVAGMEQLHMPLGNLYKNGFYNFIFTYLTYHGVIITGSLYFNNGAFIKTILLLIVVAFLLNIINNSLLSMLTGIGEITSSMPFSVFQFVHQGENVYVRMPATADRIITVLLSYCLPMVLLAIAYVRLKEKEV